MEKHVHTLGWLYILSGILSMAFGFGIFLMFSVLAVYPPRYADDPAVLASLGIGAFLFLAIGALPAIIGGLGLRRRKRWARWLVIFLGFLCLPGIPVGTALGIYTLVVLGKKETAKLFADR